MSGRQLGGGELSGLRSQLGSGELSGLRSQLGSGELSGLRSELGNGGLSGLRSEIGGAGGEAAGGRLSGLEGKLPDDGSRLKALSGKVPTDGQLSKFLGIPSDNGLHNLSGETQSKLSQAYDKVKDGDGPRSGFISGQTQKPGSRLYDQVKDGDGPFKNFIPGQTQKPGSRLYDQIKAGDGPFKNFIPGETQKPLSRLYDQIRTGNHPLRPWSPWIIHNNSIIIRRNFNNYFIFTPAWYSEYPAAWYPPAWYYGDPWIWAPWPMLAEYCGYTADPIFYEYGTNVVYQPDSVVVNGSSVGTPQQYAQQAQQLATTGSDADVSKSEKWMSLGVFAVSEEGQKSASMTMQLAVDKEGVIRGNYDNTSANETQVIHGAVDKATQRAAWTIGDKSDIVLDTGIYNLTKSETPVLVHFGDGSTKQWLMVRIDKKKGGDAAASESRSE